MGGGDRCGVYGCNNDRRYKDKIVKMDHVHEMKWFSCPPKDYAHWLHRINRQDLPRLTPNIKVCSNHFVLGRPNSVHPYPCLYMRGYTEKSHQKNFQVESLMKRIHGKTNEDMDFLETRRRKKIRKTTEDILPSKKNRKEPAGTEECPGDGTVVWTDHDYTVLSAATPASPDEANNIEHKCTEEHPYDAVEECTCTYRCDFCKMKYEKLQEENTRLLHEIEMLKNTQGPSQKRHKYDIKDIQESDHLMSLHTGVPSYALFLWILNLVLPKIPHLQYYRGAQSETLKSYQKKKSKKPGPPRLLSPANELLMVLMKLRLNLPEEFLGYLFGTCTSLVSQVLSTWLPLLAYKLLPLLYWPKQEELTLYYPDCFKKYTNVRAIIYCTEVPIQRPSLAKADSQIFSAYKGRPTVKVLVACTPAGTVSFLSKAAGGSVSDKELVKRSGIIDKFDPGDTLLADHGFNIQELLLLTGVKLAIPPFLRGKKQFSLVDDLKTKTAANARIHVERVIGRMKDFHIMKAELPLDMFDLFDHMVTVIAALINLQPPIVPLESR